MYDWLHINSLDLKKHLTCMCNCCFCRYWDWLFGGETQTRSFYPVGWSLFGESNTMWWSSWPQCGSNALWNALLQLRKCFFFSLVCAYVSGWPIPWLWRLAALEYWVAQILSSSEKLNCTHKGLLSFHEQTFSTVLELYETLSQHLWVFEQGPN